MRNYVDHVSVRAGRPFGMSGKGVFFKFLKLNHIYLNCLGNLVTRRHLGEMERSHTYLVAFGHVHTGEKRI
jgi:hypothetical protein